MMVRFDHQPASLKASNGNGKVVAKGAIGCIAVRQGRTIVGYSNATPRTVKAELQKKSTHKLHC